MRHIAREGGLLGTNDEEQRMADLITDVVVDVRSFYGKFWGEDYVSKVL